MCFAPNHVNDDLSRSNSLEMLHQNGKQYKNANTTNALMHCIDWQPCSPFLGGIRSPYFFLSLFNNNRKIFHWRICTDTVARSPTDIFALTNGRSTTECQRGKYHEFYRLRALRARSYELFLNTERGAYTKCFSHFIRTHTHIYAYSAVAK